MQNARASGCLVSEQLPLVGGLECSSSLTEGSCSETKMPHSVGGRSAHRQKT